MEAQGRRRRSPGPDRQVQFRPVQSRPVQSRPGRQVQSRPVQSRPVRKVQRGCSGGPGEEKKKVKSELGW